jgi:hypothetical protein
MQPGSQEQELIGAELESGSISQHVGPEDAEPMIPGPERENPEHQRWDVKDAPPLNYMNRKRYSHINYRQPGISIF